MNKLDILKSFLRDDFIMQKYGIRQKDIDELTLTSPTTNMMILLLRKFIDLVDTSSSTTTTAASNINQFLEQRLRQKHENSLN